MAIISAGYPRISPDRPASIDAIQWAKMAEHLGAEYWVGGTTDWAVRPVTGADRTVTVGVGTGGGAGIHDEVTEPEQVQFEPLNSGTRWDTVVARRNWADAETGFVAVRGGTSRAIRRDNTTPGAVDDQPVALCQLQSVTGGTRIGTIAHLSPRVSPGGMIVHHPESLSFLTKPGSKVYVVSEDTEYHRVLSSTGSPRWEKVLRETSGLIGVWSGNSGIWSRDLRWFKHGSMVTLVIRAYRTSGSMGSAGNGNFSRIYQLPAHLRPSVVYQPLAVSNRQGGNGRGIYMLEIGTNGQIWIYNSDPNWSIVEGTAFHSTISYRNAS